MLSVRSLLAHWPGLSAHVRRAIRDVDAGDPYALVEVANLLAESTGLDVEDACELVGIEDGAYRAVHDAQFKSVGDRSHARGWQRRTDERVTASPT